jgi:hypothetical protein
MPSIDRATATPGFIFEETALGVNYTYICYPERDGTKLHESKWRILRISESTGVTHFMWAGSNNKCDKPIVSTAGGVDWGTVLPSYTYVYCK